jgi:methionyl-tRNA formyltransferase
VAQGDVCLLLSCGRLLSAEQLALHRHNLVVHESALPQGQGWSPVTWQILEGASRIQITLSEATADLDAGPIYLQQEIALQGPRAGGRVARLAGPGHLGALPGLVRPLPRGGGRSPAPTQ